MKSTELKAKAYNLVLEIEAFKVEIRNRKVAIQRLNNQIMQAVHEEQMAERTGGVNKVEIPPPY